MYNQEQKEFQESIAKCFAAEFSSEKRREYFESRSQSLSKNTAKTTISSKALWNKLVEFGLPLMFSDKECSTFTNLAIVARESGRYLLPDGMLENIFIGSYLSSLIDESSLNDNKEEIFIAGGIKNDTDLALCLGGEKCNAFVILKNNTFYFKNIEEDSLSFEKIKLIDPLTVGYRVSIKDLKKQDSSYNLELLYKILKISECTGAIDAALEMTLEYLKTRKQFGVPVGGFQSVQHQMADAYKKFELLRASTEFATWAFDNDRSQFELSGISAVINASNNATEIIETCIQLSGGIGFTWEYDLHLFLRRVKLGVEMCKLEKEDMVRFLEVAGS